MAAVHCVIIGFSTKGEDTRKIFDYQTPDSLPTILLVPHINSYLVNGPDVILDNRSFPLASVPGMKFGNMPRDGGHLLLNEEEKRILLEEEAGAKPFVRPYISAHEFLNGISRYCIWLLGAESGVLRGLPKLKERVEAVKKFREASKAASTRGFAATPGLFAQIAQPETSYLLIPRHSSENRRYIPLGFFRPTSIAADSCLIIPDATIYHFGVLSSEMHMAWVRAVCGRLKSDYRYSKDIVYNNFPWPEPNDKQKQRISDAAQGVLDARANHPDSTLADLYDPLTMPDDLVKAHRTLDHAVDAAYGKTNFASEAERVAFLFTLYEKLTSLFPTEKPKRRKVQTN